MVREAFDAGKSGFGNLFSGVNVSSQVDRLYIRGPGERGKSRTADQSLQGYGLHSLLQMSKRILVVDLGIISHQASVLAKSTYTIVISSTNKNDGGLLPLKCCLMSISLPSERIAHDLFKGTHL